MDVSEKLLALVCPVPQLCPTEPWGCETERFHQYPGGRHWLMSSYQRALRGDSSQNSPPTHWHCRVETVVMGAGQMLGGSLVHSTQLFLGNEGRDKCFSSVMMRPC